MFAYQKIEKKIERLQLSRSCRDQQMCTRVGHCRKGGPLTRRIPKYMLDSILKLKRRNFAAIFTPTAFAHERNDQFKKQKRLAHNFLCRHGF